ncbi:MAG: hypothetical protein EOP83_04630 [Verrucomicrobiaceae bacterium]|nr:MAG: hypothetical protein EOP83_04630 [Verrucomicrobiaceae bacterium]
MHVITDSVSTFHASISSQVNMMAEDRSMENILIIAPPGVGMLYTVEETLKGRDYEVIRGVHLDDRSDAFARLFLNRSILVIDEFAALSEGARSAILMGTQAGKMGMIILMNRMLPGDYSGIDHHIYLID